MDMQLFLRGEAEDDRGRFIHEMQAYSFTQKENDHTYIQRLFPTDQRSMFNDAPIITREEALQCKLDEQVIKNMKISYKAMLDFYGLSDEYNDARLKCWVDLYNHNFLRITRIMKSLRLFGLTEEADELYRYLCDLPFQYKKKIPLATWAFWQEASEY